MYFWKIFYQIFKGKTFYKFDYIFPTNKYLKMKNIFRKIFHFKTNRAKLQQHSFEISIVTYKLNVSKYPHFIIYEQYLSYVRD